MQMVRGAAACNAPVPIRIVECEKEVQLSDSAPARERPLPSSQTGFPSYSPLGHPQQRGVYAFWASTTSWDSRVAYKMSWSVALSITSRLPFFEKHHSNFSSLHIISMAHIEHRADEGSIAQIEGQPDESSHKSTAPSLQARQRRRIAQLEEKLEALEAGRASKERQSNYYITEGRAIRHIIALFDNVEDLITKNDRRSDSHYDEENTVDQDRLQFGYITLIHTLPWFHNKAVEMEYEEYLQMMKTLRQGADSARGDDTSKLKTLIAEWVNCELKPDHPVDSNDKHSHGFSNDTCGRLLCPAEFDWNNPAVKAGIRDRSEGYIVMDLSFPAFLYDKYQSNPDDLEGGLFKGRILLQGYKAVFTSPSSAKDIEGDGDGADVIQNNRLAKKSSAGIKVKKHVAQIIKMRKVTPRSITYIACQVRFALSSTIIDFFEKPPGRDARRRVDRLLEWWTRKVFGRNHRDDISTTAKANMSINALARQRAQRDDAMFDSP
ncbi:hypothetical protein EV702DRAFT_1236929 [Suillus placidus]|uniref:Uncharacterized protein n=1 Tax=Suillus placidus TaxID=48579 RepID=A0A9P7D0I4_9AGAM|nr:hypothetical protein EV702DRAFT_1236929 [Suillus placidus]